MEEEARKRDARMKEMEEAARTEGGEVEKRAGVGYPAQWRGSGLRVARALGGARDMARERERMTAEEDADEDAWSGMLEGEEEEDGGGGVGAFTLEEEEEQE